MGIRKGMFILGDGFRKWFEGSGYTQGQLAEKLGVKQSQLSAILNGDIEPTKPIMKKLAALTGYPLDQLFVFVPGDETGAKESG